MQLWHFAALLATLGIVYFIVSSSRSKLSTSAPKPSTSNALLLSGINTLAGSIGKLIGNAKIDGPTSIPSANPSVDLGSFDTKNYSTSEGFMFTDQNGNFLAG